MIIGRWYNDRQFPPGEGIRLLNMELLLSRALFHDVEEAKTGDIPRPFKDESSYVASTLKAAGSRAFFKIIRDIVVTPDASVAAQHLWTDSKDTNTAEGCLLNFADFLSALSFLLQESLEHNATVWEHIDPMCNYFNTFRRQEYDFIRPIIDQVPPLMDRIFKGRQAERRYRP
jgi:5'-deoxynucleotidase YfbR-like HD superfamily hydrolase